MIEIKSICVYCGTGEQVKDSYKNAAIDLGAELAKENIKLVYGGGGVGLMGLVSTSSKKNGGYVTGIIPEHIQEKERKNHDVDELHVVDSMHTRKRMMIDKSDAFAVLPGGFGTLDESFELLTWKYLKLHDKPIALINIDGYWNKLIELIDHMIKEGFTPSWQRDMFIVVDNIEDVIKELKNSNKSKIKTDLNRL